MKSFKKSQKQYEVDLQNHRQEGLIKKTNFDSIIYKTYISNYLESIEIAKELYHNNKSNLWVIVINYYAMFYIANAALYKLGYKIGHKIAHQVTTTAIRVLLREKLHEQLIKDYELASEEALTLTDTILESYNQELVKRSRFQYEMTEEVKRAKAETSLKRAQKFGKTIMKFLTESL